MPFSSGTYSLYSTGNPVVTGTSISSTWANNTLNDLASGLSTCVLKDGTQTPTAPVPITTAATGLSAAGSTQGTATALTAGINMVSTVAASTGVKLLTPTIAGVWQLVYNGGANPLNVYPQTSGTINSLSANTPIILAPATAVTFYAASTTAWVGVLSA